LKQKRLSFQKKQKRLRLPLLSPFDNCENTVPEENVKLPQIRPYPHISLNQTSHRRCTGALFVAEHFASTVCKTFTLFFSTYSAVHSAKEQCFFLIINQQQQPNFSETNRAAMTCLKY
jgi:hypothetical protein